MRQDTRGARCTYVEDQGICVFRPSRGNRGWCAVRFPGAEREGLTDIDLHGGIIKQRIARKGVVGPAGSARSCCFARDTGGEERSRDGRVTTVRHRICA